MTATKFLPPQTEECDQKLKNVVMDGNTANKD